MSGSLIDTNIIIKIMNGDSKVIETFEKLDDIYLSSITVGELFYSAFKSSKVKENLKLFTDFFQD